MQGNRSYTAFAGMKLIVSAELKSMLVQTKSHLDENPTEPVLIFEDQTGRQVDFDFGGTADEILERAKVDKPRLGPGRPKLGVVSREVTLLPRHWDWLEQQPNGLSAALRRLVDEASKREPSRQQARIAWEAASKFMWAMAGNLPDFEEATRALFAKDIVRFEQLICNYPVDIRKHLTRLVQEASRLENSDRSPDAYASSE